MIKLQKGIKEWRAADHPKEEVDLRNHKLVVERLDHEAEKRNLTEVELEQRRDSFKKVAEIEKFKALDIKQKSRIKWAVDGDENTRFFHGYVNSNNRKNGIDGIMINGNWCTDPSLIKMEAFNFLLRNLRRDGLPDLNLLADISSRSFQLTTSCLKPLLPSKK
uniref:RNA-directed DNA polymerase, eukaryota n=1 Tax=Lactuca sativa TaxID=4236 RepID=A0A9R1VPU9_LACSA|nr:hypothetical protein LSAT_V11C400201510 [Lactuca sativa]